MILRIGLLQCHDDGTQQVANKGFCSSVMLRLHECFSPINNNVLGFAFVLVVDNRQRRERIVLGAFLL